jgi:RimJ/RimL family protein N-acetyltransferase
MYSEIHIRNAARPQSEINFSLRPFKDGDESALVANANNIKIFNNVKDTFPHPYTHEDAVWWVNANKQTDKPVTCLAIEVDDEIVGAIGIILGSDVQRVTAEIGYWLGENYWGKGIVTEALKRMTDYAFVNFPELVRLWAGVFEYNKSSMRVLEKAGFALEGIRKKGAIKNGVVIDEYVFVKFRE